MPKDKEGQKYLLIDLNTQKWESLPLPNELGGQALAYHLVALYQAEGNPLCFALGSLAGSAVPCTNTLSIVGKSRESATYEGETTCNRFSAYLASNLWRAIVLIGEGRRMMTLRIAPTGVTFEANERILGQSVRQITADLRGASDCGVIAIGPAGENGVIFASIFEQDLPLERWGFGCSLGEKNVKAIAVERGNAHFSPHDGQKLDTLITKFNRVLDKSEYLANFREAGDLFLMEEALKKGYCGIHNVSLRTDPRLFHLTSGEIIRRFSPVADGCEHCPALCRHRIGTMRLPNLLEMMALGPNLGNWDPSQLFEWFEECLALGLNPISTGAIIGWIMAARGERFLNTPVKVKFGHPGGVKELIHLIGATLNAGEEIKKGIVYLEENYLKKSQRPKIDSQINGRVMLPIDPRGAWMEALFMALGIDNLNVGEIIQHYLSPKGTFSKAEWTVVEENLLATFNSLGICNQLLSPLVFEKSRLPFKQLFLRSPRLAYKWLSTKLLRSLASEVLGKKISTTELINIGRKALYKKRELNGEDRELSIPERFTIDPESNHPHKSVVPFRAMAERYKFLRTLDYVKYRRG